MTVGDLVLAGGVRLSGMQWHLEQVVTGADDRAHEVSHTVSFTMGSAKVGLLSYPVGTTEEIQTAINAVNAVQRSGTQPASRNGRRSRPLRAGDVSALIRQ